MHPDWKERKPSLFIRERNLADGKFELMHERKSKGNERIQAGHEVSQCMETNATGIHWQ